jgi:predicted house-cleaning noncanonical NTP pyrophosphatase (MazG superfamily)
MSITPKNKLVRNNVPLSITEQGRTPNLKTLNDNEFEIELFNKLLDETKEVLEAKDDQEHLAEEIADVYEVIDTIIKIKNLNSDKKNKKKKQKWGGFDQKIWLTSVTEKE